MYRYSQPTFWQRVTRSIRALSISIRRLFFHLWLRYRSIDPVERKTIFDADASASELSPADSRASSAPLSERTRGGLLLSSNRRATHLLTEENQTHDDHSDDELDEASFEPDELDALAESDSSESILAVTAAHVSSQSQPRATAKTRLAAATADSSEDVPSGWLNEWFGPTSPRRNAWLFTSVTGVLGMILALLLLFSGHHPSQKPEEVSLASNVGKADPFAEPDPKPIPVIDEQPPVEEIKQPEPELVVQPEPKPEPEPEPKPDPIVVVELPQDPEPVDPEPEDQFELSVILLPDPDNVDQGETFDVSGEEVPVDMSEGFDPVAAALWRQSLQTIDDTSDPWKDLEQLVPLGPLEPQAAAVEAAPQRELSTVFLTTQPRRATESLLMPYEMAVTNQSTAAIDHLRITQRLPAALQLRSTSAIHAHSTEDRSLSWEFENLPPQETWRVPMVVIPTAKGTVALQTTLEETIRVSSQTLVLAPEIKLEILADSHAPLNKYHQLLFRMTNTGEVPLKNLRMSVSLSENLWHRFGNKFGFTEADLEVGEVRDALLHVKTLKDGIAILDAKLTTDEGAEAIGQVSFAIGTAQLSEEKPEATSPSEPERLKPLVPALEIGDGPDTKPERPMPIEKKPAVPEETPLIPSDSAPDPLPEKPELPQKAVPSLDDFPAFPADLAPLPTKKIDSGTERPPVEKKPDPVIPERTEQKDPFELPPKKEPVEDLFKSDK